MDTAPDAEPKSDSPYADDEALPEAGPIPPEADATAPPKSAIDWQRTRITPALVRALVKAQSAATTVGKGGRNKGTEKQDGYDYATADSMIAEARSCFSGAGIAWVCASRAVEPPSFDLGNQWACSLIITESILLHVDEHDVIGQLVTRSEVVSIGSAGRPPDKADKAGESYLRGFIARDLLALDRGKVAATDDVDARTEDPSAGGKGRAASSAKPDAAVAREETELRAKVQTHLTAIQESRRAAGEAVPSKANLVAEAMQSDVEWSPRGIEDWRELAQRLATTVASQHSKATAAKTRRTAASSTSSRST